MNKQINQQAPVKCSKSITINATAPQVWAVLTDINKWSNWQTDISHPKSDGLLQPDASFTWKTGGAAIRSTLHTVEINKSFGWTGKTFGLFAVHNWTLQERNGKTTVSVEESMEGLLALLLKKAFNKNLDKGMQLWLDLLKNETEKVWQNTPGS